MDLSEESRRAFREFLTSYDTNHDGVIDARELGMYLRQMGMCISDQGVRFLSKTLDNNHDGRLQIDELLDNMDTINKLAITHEDLIDAFKMIDVKKLGYIRIQDLRSVMMHGDDGMTWDEASVVIENLRKEYDTNRDGKFSYQEFVEMFMNSAFPFQKPELVKNHDPFRQERRVDDSVN